MAEPWTTITGTKNTDNFITGGGTNSKGDLVETNTYIAGGVLANETRVTKENTGATDIYIDKTWA